MSHVSDPAKHFAAITPHDVTAIPEGPTRGIYVGGAGDVTVIDTDGNAVTFSAVPAGTVLPVVTTRVNSTNTTATLLVGLR